MICLLRYSKKEFLPYAVLSYVYGNGVCVPYGNGQGILNKALKKSGAIAAVSGFRANYSDSGLVGFFLVADSNDVVKVRVFLKLFVNVLYNLLHLSVEQKSFSLT